MLHPSHGFLSRSAPTLGACPLVAARAGHAHALLDMPTALLLADAVSLEGETVSLDALGTDIFTFLTASVLVAPLSRVLGVTPVLINCLIHF